MLGPHLSRSILVKSGVAFVLVALGAACGSGSDRAPSVVGEDPADGGNADGRSQTTPTVVSATPASGSAGVPINGSASATFSEPMDRASLNTTTFTVSAGAAAVPGTVVYSKSTAVFWPAAHFAPSTVFTATITTAAKSAFGVALAASYSWTFTTGTAVAPGAGVDLGTAGTFAILAKSGISTVPTSAITGDIGVSPVAATAITGFPLTADFTNVFSTTPQVTGKVYASDFKPPTPANMTTAIGDMEIAFTDAAARAPGATELHAGDIGGKVIVPGVYKWGTGLLIPIDVTLTGSATDIWIFQIAQNLTMSSAAKVVLSGGALPKNIYWQVAGAVALGTTAHCEGIVLSQTQITLATGASVNGRLLAQTAVTLAGNAVVQPAP